MCVRYVHAIPGPGQYRIPSTMTSWDDFTGVPVSVHITLYDLGVSLLFLASVFRRFLAPLSKGLQHSFSRSGVYSRLRCRLGFNALTFSCSTKFNIFSTSSCLAQIIITVHHNLSVAYHNCYRAPQGVDSHRLVFYAQHSYCSWFSRKGSWLLTSIMTGFCSCT